MADDVVRLGVVIDASGATEGAEQHGRAIDDIIAKTQKLQGATASPPPLFPPDPSVPLRARTIDEIADKQQRLKVVQGQVGVGPLFPADTSIPDRVKMLNEVVTARQRVVAAGPLPPIFPPESNGPQQVQALDAVAARLPVLAADALATKQSFEQLWEGMMAMGETAANAVSAATEKALASTQLGTEASYQAVIAATEKARDEQIALANAQTEAVIAAAQREGEGKKAWYKDAVEAQIASARQANTEIIAGIQVRAEKEIAILQGAASEAAALNAKTGGLGVGISPQQAQAVDNVTARLGAMRAAAGDAQQSFDQLWESMMTMANTAQAAIAKAATTTKNTTQAEVQASIVAVEQAAAQQISLVNAQTEAVIAAAQRGAVGQKAWYKDAAEAQILSAQQANEEIVAGIRATAEKEVAILRQAAAQQNPAALIASQFAALKTTLAEQAAVIQVSVQQELLSPASAAAAGRANALAYNQALLALIKQGQAQGAFAGPQGQQLFVQLSKSFQQVGTGATQAFSAAGNAAGVTTAKVHGLGGVLDRTHGSVGRLEHAFLSLALSEAQSNSEAARVLFYLLQFGTPVKYILLLVSALAAVVTIYKELTGVQEETEKRIRAVTKEMADQRAEAQKSSPLVRRVILAEGIDEAKQHLENLNKGILTFGERWKFYWEAFRETFAASAAAPGEAALTTLRNKAKQEFAQMTADAQQAAREVVKAHLDAIAGAVGNLAGLGAKGEATPEQLKRLKELYDQNTEALKKGGLGLKDYIAAMAAEETGFEALHHTEIVAIETSAIREKQLRELTDLQAQVTAALMGSAGAAKNVADAQKDDAAAVAKAQEVWANHTKELHLTTLAHMTVEQAARAGDKAAQDYLKTARANIATAKDLSRELRLVDYRSESAKEAVEQQKEFINTRNQLEATIRGGLPALDLEKDKQEQQAKAIALAEADWKRYTAAIGDAALAEKTVLEATTGADKVAAVVAQALIDKQTMYVAALNKTNFVLKVQADLQETIGQAREFKLPLLGNAPEWLTNLNAALGIFSPGEDGRKERDALQAKLKQMADNVREGWISAFEGIFKRGRDGFLDLFRNIEDMGLKAAAGITAAFLYRGLGIDSLVKKLVEQSNFLSATKQAGVTAQVGTTTDQFGAIPTFAKAPNTGLLRGFSLAGSAFAGLGVGYGLGSQIGGTAGVLAGAAGGAITGAAIAGPVGAVLGGVAGLVGGLFGSAAKARAAAEAMAKAQREFARPLDDFVAIAHPRGPLGDAFANLKKQAQDLEEAAKQAAGKDYRKQTLGGGDVTLLTQQQIANALAGATGAGRDYLESLLKIRKAYDDDIAAAQKAYTLETTRAVEDLKSREDVAKAATTASFASQQQAEATAFAEKQQREMQDAVTKYGNTVSTGNDAIDAANKALGDQYLAQLSLTQSAEAAAFALQQQRAAEQHAFEVAQSNATIQARILELTGHQTEADTARKRIAADAEINDARKLLEAGTITQETFEALSKALNDSLDPAMQAAAEAAKAAAGIMTDAAAKLLSDMQSTADKALGLIGATPEQRGSYALGIAESNPVLNGILGGITDLAGASQLFQDWIRTHLPSASDFAHWTQEQRDDYNRTLDAMAPVIRAAGEVAAAGAGAGTVEGPSGETTFAEAIAKSITSVQADTMTSYLATISFNTTRLVEIESGRPAGTINPRGVASATGAAFGGLPSQTGQVLLDDRALAQITAIAGTTAVILGMARGTPEAIHVQQTGTIAPPPLLPPAPAINVTAPPAPPATLVPAPLVNISAPPPTVLPSAPIPAPVVNLAAPAAAPLAIPAPVVNVAVPPQAPPVVNVDGPTVNVAASAPLPAPAAPTIAIPAPVVNLSAPAQASPIVNVAASAPPTVLEIPAPVVNVAAPPPLPTPSAPPVVVPAPVVNVAVPPPAPVFPAPTPASPAPIVNVLPTPLPVVNVAPPPPAPPPVVNVGGPVVNVAGPAAPLAAPVLPPVVVPAPVVNLTSPTQPSPIVNVAPSAPLALPAPAAPAISIPAPVVNVAAPPALQAPTPASPVVVPAPAVNLVVPTPAPPAPVVVPAPLVNLPAPVVNVALTSPSAGPVVTPAPVIHVPPPAPPPPPPAAPPPVVNVAAPVLPPPPPAPPIPPPVAISAPVIHVAAPPAPPPIPPSQPPAPVAIPAPVVNLPAPVVNVALTSPSVPPVVERLQLPEDKAPAGGDSTAEWRRELDLLTVIADKISGLSAAPTSRTGPTLGGAKVGVTINQYFSGGDAATVRRAARLGVTEGIDQTFGLQFSIKQDAAGMPATT